MHAPSLHFRAKRLRFGTIVPRTNLERLTKAFRTFTIGNFYVYIVRVVYDILKFHSRRNETRKS